MWVWPKSRIVKTEISLQSYYYVFSTKELVGWVGGRRAEDYRTGRRLRIASALVLQDSYE